MNEIATQEQSQSTFQGRALATPHSANIGSVTIEAERAIAEVQGQLILAKRFPRSMIGAKQEFLEACKSPEFAATAFYAVPNRGNGPSIRFAEEAARCYGNIDYGHRELGRTEAGINGPGKSEVEVYVWDKEKNNRSTRQITVIHVTDTKNGPKRLIDQTDIDNKIANVASKQMRGRILAVVSKDLISAGIAECKRTIAGAAAGTLEKPLAVRIQGLCAGFAKYGVSIERLEKHLGHKVDDITIDEFADLVGIGNALKEGGKPSEFFPSDSAVDETQAPAAVAIATAAKKPSSAAAAATTSTKVEAAASKPAKSTSKAVKDEAPAPEETAKEAAPIGNIAELPASDITDEANAAAAAASEEPDVF